MFDRGATEAARPRLTVQTMFDHQGYDFLENPYDVKMAAINFAHQLCMRKKAPHMQKFMAFMLGVLGTFAAERTAGAISQVASQRMDGALMAIGSLSNILHKKVGRQVSVGRTSTPSWPSAPCPSLTRR
jgi:hypothetical protein